MDIIKAQQKFIQAQQEFIAALMENQPSEEITDYAKNIFDEFANPKNVTKKLVEFSCSREEIAKCLRKIRKN